jgi:DNA-binding response OmpR family regulator
MSATKDYELWVDCLSSGMDDFITKPFNINTFINVVASLRPEYTDKDRTNSLDDSLGGSEGFKKSDDLRDSQHTDKGLTVLDAKEKNILSKEIKNVEIINNP